MRKKLFADEQWLREQYINNERTCVNIAKELNIAYNTLYKKLKKCNIPIRTGYSDILGKKFDRLLVIKRIGSNNLHKMTWLCKCDCGNEKIVTGSGLLNGSTRSCGCLQRERTGNAARNRVISDATRRRMSENHPDISGDKNPRYIDGRCKNKDTYCELWTAEFRNRIRAFHNYECFMCGKTKEQNNNIMLGCHHVCYDKNTCCNDTPRLFVALCNKCHGKVGLNRNRWEEIFKIALDEIYDGKSYYTKEEYYKRDDINGK
jgi:hypothetical protein